MTDIYLASLQAKYESVLQVISADLGFGDQLTALRRDRLDFVHAAADQAILDWAARRRRGTDDAQPASNLQHLLNEYCAIADHM